METFIIILVIVFGVIPAFFVFGWRWDGKPIEEIFPEIKDNIFLKLYFLWPVIICYSLFPFPDKEKIAEKELEKKIAQKKTEDEQARENVRRGKERAEELRKKEQEEQEASRKREREIVRVQEEKRIKEQEELERKREIRSRQDNILKEDIKNIKHVKTKIEKLSAEYMFFSCDNSNYSNYDD